MVVVLGACSTTEFVSTWTSPAVQPNQLAGKRVAALLVSPNTALRRSGEDALARELISRGIQGVPGYTLTGTEPTMDKDQIRATFGKAGVDGAVVMRVIDRHQEVTYVPGSIGYAGDLYGYWDYGWTTVGDPGYLTTDTYVTVETLVYSLPDARLLWAGVSETVDPERVDKAIQEIVDKAADEMKKSGLMIR